MTVHSAQLTYRSRLLPGEIDVMKEELHTRLNHLDPDLLVGGDEFIVELFYASSDAATVRQQCLVDIKPVLGVEPTSVLVLAFDG